MNVFAQGVFSVDGLTACTIHLQAQDTFGVQGAAVCYGEIQEQYVAIGSTVSTLTYAGDVATIGLHAFHYHQQDGTAIITTATLQLQMPDKVSVVVFDKAGLEIASTKGLVSLTDGSVKITQ